VEVTAKRRERERWPRATLEQWQVQQFNQLLSAILPQNEFYANKFRGLPTTITDIAQLAQYPCTTKDDLAATPTPGRLSVNQTWPTERYSRYHQTSGTRGRPQIVLETRDDWHWWMEVWQAIFDAADVRPGDRVLMAFSFGPFIGFWSAYDAAVERGCLLIPCGGMSSLARLELAKQVQANVVMCTPSYALHLVEVGQQQQLPVDSLGVRQLVLAGEPGGSIPAVRDRIAQAWQAHVHDHCGATEVGPWGYGDRHGAGLYVIETDFIAEFVQPNTDQPAQAGELAELVLTCLGRVGSPCIRYRTRDLVRPIWQHDHERQFVFLSGGILGRVDDMLVIRGVNLFPSSIDAILREFPEVSEYRATVTTVSAMDQVTLEVEDQLHDASRIMERLRSRLGLKIDVTIVPPGTLPRFEGKGKRWLDQRTR
jgi:phenylacetate-CoA ligase